MKENIKFDMTVPCGNGLLNIRVGAIIMKKDKILMVANSKNPEYLYSVGGRIKFGETAEEAVIREVYEETGISIDKSKITLFNINSKPDDSKQDIGFRFYALLDGTIDDYIFSLAHMEHNEVEYVKWQNVNKLDEINWAWNHKQIVKKILNKVF